jgi:hypothetical protein
MGKLYQFDSAFLCNFICKTFLKKDGIEANFFKILMLFVVTCFVEKSASAQIAAWDFTGPGNVATFSATTFDINLISSGGFNNVTRGAGAAASTGVNSFRTQKFSNDGILVSNTDYFQITLSPVPGYKLSLSTINADLNGTDTYAALTGVSNQFAYSLDGSNFKLIGNPVIVIGAPKSLPQIDLSGIPELQNIASGVTVTIRYYASGQTTSGGWGFYSSVAGKNGLAIGGSLTPSASTLSFIALPSTGITNQSLSAFSVEVRKYDNTLDKTFSGNITLTKASGPGSINGTLSLAAISGVSTFNNVSFDQPGNYTITAAANSTISVTSGTITISESSLPTDYFRSNVVSGDWQSSLAWQSSHDNINWFPSTIIPGNLSRGISIRNGHTIRLATNVNAKLLTIESGGTLTNTNVSGGYLLTIEDDGTLASDFNIYGTYILFGKIPVFNVGAIATVFANGLVRADENIGSENFASSTDVFFKTGGVFEWNNGNAFNTQLVTYFPNAINDVPIFRISKATPLLGSTKINIWKG